MQRSTRIVLSHVAFALWIILALILQLVTAAAVFGAFVALSESYWLVGLLVVVAMVAELTSIAIFGRVQRTIPADVDGITRATAP